ncbi:short-chain fatty acyl-CoA regulator family protein, partial [Saccharopolyspora hordei]|uniref:short-chain fatty acyl-CoA regulator family protein n=1 Tax=Saccharopolyspora hordei TaxID=1838 RepID=UPI0035EB17BD
MALPLEPLCVALQELGAAPDRLADRFQVPFDQVLRRLALLPPKVMAQASLPAPGLVICDNSGTLVFRRGLEGFALPRFGGACPLWPLYQSLQRPYMRLRMPVMTAGRLGRRFLTYAYASAQTEMGFGMPNVLHATMLILPTDAVPDAGAEPLSVGASCRTCAQLDCAARREPSI